MNSQVISSAPIAFSICIPCYNSRKFLRETLESIRAQTHPNWELIIVEDASPEPSHDIVEEFAARVSQQVRYLASATNQGIAVSRDLAIEKAAYPILAILDADDLWHPDHLASLATIYQSGNPEFVFSGFSIFNQKLRGSDVFRDSDVIMVPSSEDLLDLRAACFFRHCHIPTGTISFQRELLNKIGIFSQGLNDRPSWLPNRNWCEDGNFLLRVFHSNAVLACTGKVTFAYRKHSESTTGQNFQGGPYRACDYNRYGIVYGLPILAQWRFFGYLNRQAGDDLREQDPKTAAWFYLRAWCWYPLRIDRLFQSLRTIFTRKSS